MTDRPLLYLFVSRLRQGSWVYMAAGESRTLAVFNKGKDRGYAYNLAFMS